MADIKLKDGRIVRNVPTGIGRDDLYRLADQQAAQTNVDAPDELSTAPKIAPWGGTPASELNPIGKMVEGAAGAFTRGGLGIKGMFTDLSPENEQTLQQIDQFNNEAGGFGTTGKIAGDVASFMLPAGKIAKGLKAGMEGITAAPKLMRALAPVVENVGAGAITSAALSPDDRTGAAIGGGIGGGIGAGIGYGLGKLGGGALSSAVTPEARSLLDQGVDVPLWKATENKVVRGLYERAKALPYAKEIMGGQEARAFEQVAGNVAGKSTPPQPIMDEAGQILRWVTNPVKKPGSEGVSEIADRFDEAYKAVYQGRTVPVELVRDASKNLDEIVSANERYNPSLAADLRGAWVEAKDILDRARGVVQGRVQTEGVSGHKAIGGEDVRAVIKMLDDRVTDAFREGKGSLAKQYQEMSAVMSDLRMKGLPPEVQAQLEPITAAYTTFKQLQRANAGIAAQGKGFVTPRQILAAIKSGDKSLDKAAFSRGHMPNQSEMINAEKVLGSSLPDVGPGTAEKVLPWLLASGVVGGGAVGGPLLAALPIAAGAAATKTGQRFLTGSLPGQGAIRMATDKTIIPTSRTIGALIGSGMGEDELKKAPRRR